MRRKSLIIIILLVTFIFSSLVVYANLCRDLCFATADSCCKECEEQFKDDHLKLGICMNKCWYKLAICLELCYK